MKFNDACTVLIQIMYWNLTVGKSHKITSSNYQVNSYSFTCLFKQTVLEFFDAFVGTTT